MSIRYINAVYPGPGQTPPEHPGERPRPAVVASEPDLWFAPAELGPSAVTGG
jgi:hypothetical protein